jgi:para-nitrobenzyl esterase
MGESTVQTTGGRVGGPVIAGGVRSYRGIPYAAAPFGAARLLAPGPAPAWAGVRAASAYGPIPPQPAAGYRGFPAWSPDSGTDILTVNVWVPEDAPPGPLPVLAWVYGGAYTTGCADVYDPTALARAGLVVVTLNYRTGFEGFAHVPGAPDNRGLLDQVAALRWVRDNIAGFGGDPSNVTIAGQSAGAGSVAALAVMPAAAGLFRRVIAHSVPSEFFAPEAAAELGERIARQAGVPATLAALAALPPAAALEAQAAVAGGFWGDPRAGIRHYLPTIYNPVADGEVLPAAPLPAITAGAAAGTDLLLCHTLEEFRLFSVGRAVAPRVRTEAELAAVAAACGLDDERLAGYRAARPAGEPLEDTYAAIVTDFVFGEYTTRLAEAAAGAGGRAWLARFAWRSPAAGGKLGACHAADIPFCFGSLDAATGIAPLVTAGQVTDAERALSRRMIASWAAFAAAGDPGWPAVTPASTPVRTWNREDSLADDPGPAAGTRASWADLSYPLTVLAGG